MNYVVISPVKDEERHIARTLRSMAAQTQPPRRWIIVNDGSSDGTAAIIETHRRELDFLEVVTTPAGQPRQPGSAVIRAFNRGLEALGSPGGDCIVKLDCDLSFEPDYFASLMARFDADATLGIASGVYLEAPDGTHWQPISMPPYHAAGASKVVRAACFEAIGGFVPARGWDTVDEVRAMARGWKTTHFADLEMRHWKIEGSGIGPVRTHSMHGEIYYLTGGGPLFFAFKLLHRMKSRPYFVGACAMLYGYLRALASRRERLVTRDEARLYRSLLNARLAGAAASPVAPARRA